VWFDALASYLSVLGYPDRTPELERHFFEPHAEREHLIGKDILRFHAVYWPAILLSAGLPLPTGIKAHGFVTLRGSKIGKSLGNGIDPFALVERLGVDAVRFYFLRHLHSTKDSDFGCERLVEAHDSELSGKLGNLLQRSTSLSLRHGDLIVTRAGLPESEADRALSAAADRALSDVRAAVDEFALHQAVASIFELVGAANRYADAQEPWVLSRLIRVASSEDDARVRLGHVLWHLFESLRVTAVLLAPFLPRAAAAIISRLGVPTTSLATLDEARFGLWPRFVVLPGAPLFPKLAERVASSLELA
jgi:methionyl-tRNA synthetase